MSHLVAPRFPRGFLLSERPVDPPPGYEPGPLLEHFWVHPWTTVAHAGGQELFVIVIGHAVPTTPGLGEDPAGELVSKLRESEAVFFEALSEYSGRYAIIFGSVGDLKVVNDATGMRSVFYATTGGVIASHALLVEQSLGGPVERVDLPVQYGYPGNRTPYPRTKVLTANTYYWMTAGVVARFWPRHRIATVSVDEAATVLLERSVHALQHIAKGRDVQLTLTAGLDSRTIYTIALASGVPFATYTYGDNKVTTVDRLIGEELAHRHDIDHTVINTRTTSDELIARLGEANYLGHHVSWVEALLDHYQDHETVGVLGNALEIGRSHTMLHREAEGVTPTTASGMARLHYRRMGAGKRKTAADEYGYDHFHAISASMFQEFIDDTGYGLVADWFNPFDLFYWEYRMSVWQGPAMNERDFYSVPFIPFNARFVYETMLGVSEQQRYADEVVFRMIEMVDPALLELPINPAKWTRKQTAASR
jgi:hypothetical protein